MSLTLFGVAKEAVTDGLGAVLAGAVLGPVLPDTDNVLVQTLASGLISTVGSVGAKMVLFGAPLPTDLTRFADDVIYNAAFIAGSGMLGATDAVVQLTNTVGLGGNAQIQEVAISGIISAGGGFVRDAVRQMYGPSVLTDPISATLGRASQGGSGLIFA
jgi:hypothetical protein